MKPLICHTFCGNGLGCPCLDLKAHGVLAQNRKNKDQQAMFLHTPGAPCKSEQPPSGCCLKIGGPFCFVVRVLLIRALLFGVNSRPPDFDF